MPITDKKSARYNALLVNGQGFYDRVSVGIHEQEGSDEHEKSEGVSIVEIGSINEFGQGVPERSFIRAWFDENRSVLPEALRLELEASLRAGEPATVALDRFAVTAEGSIQKRISGGIEPENAASTIARKGSSKPLIDTEDLRSAILAKRESRL